MVKRGLVAPTPTRMDNEMEKAWKMECTLAVEDLGFGFRA